MKELAYKLLDLLLLGRGVKTTISGVEIRIPTRYFRYYHSDYEHDNIAFFKTAVKKGDCVLDIGAQMGLMTKIFCDLVGDDGKVYAFEPTPSTFALLEKTIEINKIMPTAFPQQKAVAEKSGTAVFNISEHIGDNANSMTSTSDSRLNRTIDVSVTSVDDFVTENSLKQVNFIKIDVEGAEYAVLKGSHNTIMRDRPKINLALHPMSIAAFGDSLQKIYDYISTINYHIRYQNKEIDAKDFLNTEYLFDVQLMPKHS